MLPAPGLNFSARDRRTPSWLGEERQPDVWDDARSLPGEPPCFLGRPPGRRRRCWPGRGDSSAILDEAEGGYAERPSPRPPSPPNITESCVGQRLRHGCESRPGPSTSGPLPLPVIPASLVRILKGPPPGLSEGATGGENTLLSRAGAAPDKKRSGSKRRANRYHVSVTDNGIFGAGFKETQCSRGRACPELDHAMPSAGLTLTLSAAREPGRTHPGGIANWSQRSSREAGVSAQPCVRAGRLAWDG